MSTEHYQPREEKSPAADAFEAQYEASELNLSAVAKLREAERFPEDVEFSGAWDSVAVRKKIDERIAKGRRPSWMFLGKEEAALLRKHLVEAFGQESVESLHRVYYMGLEVIEVEAPNFCRIAGHKFMSTLERANADLRKWKEDDFSRWRFHA